jgi:hypothetical protein
MGEILAHIGLMTDTQQGRSAVGKEITEFRYSNELVSEPSAASFKALASSSRKP